jgi:hypothetical protein
MDITKFEKLIQEFSKLPKAEVVLPTYLEISGQPHFENVCSNILAYFFNTNESHCLQDLVLKSFIECYDESLLGKFDIETIQIKRELYIDEQKRIDIVIECNELVITIENKIYHILNNELKKYEEEIYKLYPDKKPHSHFIVLSLKEENPDKPFISITYDKFFQKLKQNLGGYFVNTNNQYTTFLIDFIQTIENLTKMKKHNQKYIEFYFKNMNEVESLVKEHEDLKKALYTKVSHLYDSLSTAENSNIIKKWIYLKNVIVVDFNFNGIIVGLDVVITFNKIEFDLIARDSKNLEFVRNLSLFKTFTDYKINGKRIIFKETEIIFTEIEQELFLEELSQIISMIKI